MTLRVLVSVDPGTQGSYAIFMDGELDRVTRIPTVRRIPTKERKGGTDIVLVDLLKDFRHIMQQHPGAHFQAVVEQVGVQAMGRTGTLSVAKLAGIAYAIHAMLFTLGFKVDWVQPRVWKQFHGLKGSDKDLSRAKAKELYPWLELNTKVSADLAEAVLIGVYGCDRYGP